MRGEKKKRKACLRRGVGPPGGMGGIKEMAMGRRRIPVARLIARKRAATSGLCIIRLLAFSRTTHPWTSLSKDNYNQPVHQVPFGQVPVLCNSNLPTKTQHSHAGYCLCPSRPGHLQW